MKLDMSTLNVKNFSYFAFNPKAPSLSNRDKRIVVLAHVLLSLTLGIGHAISVIIYVVRFGDFKDELLKFANTANSANRIALAGFKLPNVDIEVLGTLQSDPSQYICRINTGSYVPRLNLQEAELKKIIQDKSAGIEDDSYTLDDDRFGINASSKVRRNECPYEEIKVNSIDNSHTPALYSCSVHYNDGTTYIQNLTEGLLKKVIQDKTASIQDYNRILDDAKFNIDSSSKVFKSPLPHIPELDFSNIDYISVNGIIGGSPNKYSCMVIKKHGQTQDFYINEEDFEKIIQGNFAKVENPMRYFGTEKQQQVEDIERMTGLNLSIIDEIIVTLTKHTTPVIHECRIFYSNGKIDNISLKDKKFQKIAESNLVKIHHGLYEAI